MWDSLMHGMGGIGIFFDLPDECTDIFFRAAFPDGMNYSGVPLARLYIDMTMFHVIIPQVMQL